MPSNTKQTKAIRRRKKTKSGTDRKRDIRVNGTTKSKEELFGDEN